MVNEFIHSIEFSTNNQDLISIMPSNFKNFYIANINEDGDEVSYGVSNNHLIANYFMIKIINDKSKDAYTVIERLLNKQDIINIAIHFTNGKTQLFDIPKKRVQKDGILINKYEDAFYDEDDLCIIISDKDIKYKKELFA
ncbi:MAG: hypothetical protein K5666_00360 [Bacilli bacterium]|jgi:adenine C2-methylase RlmN of 23S rRNA A2503 and tRNA A37|nr:hypothetical protein [Bacilli bacterium]